MTSPLNRLIAVSAFSLLAGCASVADQKAALSQDVQPCCAALGTSALIPYQARPFSVEVQERSPATLFATGKSRYVVIDLGPLETRPRHLALSSGNPTSSVFTAGRGWSPMFYPAATLLNEQWEVLSTVDNTVQGPGGCSDRGNCRTKTLDVEVPLQARYLAVHTPERLIGERAAEPMGWNAPTTTYSIKGALVTAGGGMLIDYTIGMSYGKVDVLPVEFGATP